MIPVIVIDKIHCRKYMGASSEVGFVVLYVFLVSLLELELSFLLILGSILRGCLSLYSAL